MASRRAPRSRFRSPINNALKSASTPNGLAADPEMRVGDDERNEVVEKLRRASSEGRITLSEFEDRSAEAYDARVRSQLLPLLDDLPIEPPTTTSVVQSAEGPRSSPWVVSLFGAGRQLGNFRPAPRTNAISVAGVTRLDLTEADLVDDELVIRAVGLLGSVDVIVPDHIETDMSGFSFFGLRSHRSRGPHQTGTKRVVVRAYAVFGMVTIRNRRRRFRRSPTDS